MFSFCFSGALVDVNCHEGEKVETEEDVLEGEIKCTEYLLHCWMARIIKNS